MAAYFAFLHPAAPGKVRAPVSAPAQSSEVAIPEAAPAAEPATGLAKQAVPPASTNAVADDAMAPMPPIPGNAIKHDGSKGKSRLPAPVTVAPAAPAQPAPAPAPASEPVAAPAPPVAAREVPKPDRWQQMSAALAPCAREDFFGRIVCEQRVRTEYCDGYWGQVPLCATAQGNDRAR
jgi:hypothetical protein